mgnify:CR=1 FL=1
MSIPKYNVAQAMATLACMGSFDVFGTTRFRRIEPLVVDYTPPKPGEPCSRPEEVRIRKKASHKKKMSRKKKRGF